MVRCADRETGCGAQLGVQLCNTHRHHAGPPTTSAYLFGGTFTKPLISDINGGRHGDKAARNQWGGVAEFVHIPGRYVGERRKSGTWCIWIDL